MGLGCYAVASGVMHHIYDLNQGRSLQPAMRWSKWARTGKFASNGIRTLASLRCGVTVSRSGNISETTSARGRRKRGKRGKAGRLCDPRLLLRSRDQNIRQRRKVGPRFLISRSGSQSKHSRFSSTENKIGSLNFVQFYFSTILSRAKT